jgi:hypothetical protein
MDAARKDPQVEAVADGLARRQDEDLLTDCMTVFRAGTDYGSLYIVTRQRYAAAEDFGVCSSHSERAV